MDFTVLFATAFSAELFLPHFQPVATIVALHIAVLLLRYMLAYGYL